MKTLADQLKESGDRLTGMLEDGRMNSFEFSAEHKRYMRICRKLNDRDRDRKS